MERRKELIAILEKVSNEDLIEATERSIGFGLKGDSSLRDFISILKEYELDLS